MNVIPEYILPQMGDDFDILLVGKPARIGHHPFFSASPGKVEMSETAITRMLGIRYPIVSAPMFLISDVAMVVAVSEAGGLGTFPALNYRTTEQFRSAVQEIKTQTTAPFGVNLIIHGNPRLETDLRVCLEEGVPVIITSLGNPEQVIKAAHAHGAKVFCDVIGLKHAEKCAAVGADAVIAVSAGAGGHAGTISPFVLVPFLKRHLAIPVLAAGGISDGAGMVAAFALGASAVYLGTRFIATEEAPAPQGYKDMILQAVPEDIEYTPEVSGHPANFLKPSLETFRANGEQGADTMLRPSAWKEVWSAGHGVGLIQDLPTCRDLVQRLISEYEATRKALPVF